MLCPLALSACSEKTTQSTDDAVQDGAPDTGTLPDGSGDAQAPLQVPEFTDPDDNYDYAKGLIPRVDFEQRPLRILVAKSTTQYDVNNGELSRNVVATPNLGIAINDAVFSRNEYLQSQLNIKICAIEKPLGTVADELANSIFAQDDRYDVCFARLDRLSPWVDDGFFADLSRMNLSLDKPWWDQNSIEELSVLNKLYFAVCDGDIVDKQATMACMYNKDLLVQQGLDADEVYDLVSDGTWTVDAMLKMATGCRKDADYNGIMDENDIWPILTEYDSAMGFYYAFGGSITAKNTDDEPYLTMGSGEVRSAINKALKDVMLDDYNVCKVEKLTGVSNVWLSASEMFANDKAAFRITNLTTVERWRDSGVNYGIAPMPKLDENQSDYIHLAKWGATAVCVPVTNRNLDFTATCLEAFVSTSRYTLFSSYLSTLCECLPKDDAHSLEMLRLIFDTRTYDLGYVFDFGRSTYATQDGYGALLVKMATNRSTAFDSMYDSMRERAQKQIDELLEKLSKL